MLLRCESLEAPMSHMGHSRRTKAGSSFADVRFTSDSDPNWCVATK